ncbi:MAG: hypothetical protein KJ905_02745 [Nanoarchaeota archaeon]|nr:hypothetical protein [Nanoarchaeota archaeon]MBU1501667.1 hypothetical protein [Nanoarchaeota archaeon]MBU2459204.1 hypothetical protein [Nanoarchaeota archaeon]
MSEKDTVFSSKIKYNGILSFKDFYKFCYDWLKEETELDMIEDSYNEKISGDTKEIRIKWSGDRKITDYFRFDIKVEFIILGLKNVEISQGGAKIKTNQGSVEMSVKGVLVSDFQGRFDTSGFNKWMRGVYEKWIISSRVAQFTDKIAGDCDEFLSQAKAYLDLEGKK